ncbi:MAG TPA: GNAT family N-acetyltransferase [Catenuloplanes sp.]|jgi:RimJ/RimL family protein N-acetyltransferase
MRTLLTTPRLRLSPFCPADTAELHELFSDPLTHTIGSGPFTSISQTEGWIRNRQQAQRDHGLCWYALRDRETNRLIGNCGMLRGRTTYTQPELGYLVDRSCRGRGFATEAAVAVLRECRAAGISRVWASIRPANTASRRIAERLGMRIDRTDSDDRGDLLFYVIDLSTASTARWTATRDSSV